MTQAAREAHSTPGIDMCYVGPGDSSIELGHPGDYDHPDVREPMEHILELCKKYEIAFGTTPSNGESAGEWVRKGALFFEADSEIGFIREGAKALLADYRKHID